MVVTPREFWAGRRVFLTGHTGFKGSWLSIWLKDLGANLTGFALPAPTKPSLFEAADVASGMNSIIGDIRDADTLINAMRDARPEVVIHMAAQPIVRLSYEQPIETYSTNVMGLVHMFEAVRKSPGVRAVVNVTSDKCYENKEWVWGYRETEAMGGHDPYSSSKGCAELVTTAYRRSFFNPDTYNQHRVALASARAGNVIGGGDWARDRLIPDIMRAIEAKQLVRIRNPHAIRPWQHVLEPLSGYLNLAQKLFEAGPAFAEGWNFGPSETDARPVQWIVEHLTQMWGDGAGWQLDQQDNPLHEAHYLKLDCSKARSELGWKPIWSLEQALSRIADWHKVALQGGSAYAKTLAQVRDYQEELGF
ncbi:CDP-glucose 4,6-dehydratase [Bradyrhizobium sp. CCGUVB4N]|uniref:CDP-glucose 4,6-dehydratase n=1 Tax=Bradyrhizobium sp. CCGUVB4N TaxID=2949631 RepID=UPI0020B2A4C4|nr:CDP-glucose 4,6-dehydratase [Bradyrhizobium sp. CCGUVB4N]MCP3384584.1 CDP-glucose 4,6-dehydratase [Bradyrhizobium sp. CCGUVB4N]